MSVKPEPDPNHVRTLFVLFPRRNKDREAIKSLHPGIEQVKFSRKRAGKWCHLRFETEELANHARQVLHKKKVPHGRLIVSETRKKKEVDPDNKPKPEFNILYVAHIPKVIKKEDLKSAFKTCKKIRIRPTRSRQQYNAHIIMRTHAEALELFADKESHIVKGIPLNLKFPTSYYASLQDAQKESEDMNGNQKLGEGTMETEVKEENSDTSQNSAVQVGKANSSDENMQEEETEDHLNSPALQDISDDDMEG